MSSPNRIPSCIGLPLVLIALAGCRLPWEAQNDVPAIQASSLQPADVASLAAAGKNTDAKPPGNGTSSPSGSAFNLPKPEPTEEEAMAEVLAELQEIGAIDPAAQQALMGDLRKAKPSNWPLIVQSFRAALAYRQQLIARESPTSQPSGVRLVEGNTSPTIEKDEPVTGSKAALPVRTASSASHAIPPTVSPLNPHPPNDTGPNATPLPVRQSPRQPSSPPVNPLRASVEIPQRNLGDRENHPGVVASHVVTASHQVNALNSEQVYQNNGTHRRHPNDKLVGDLRDTGGRSAIVPAVFNHAAQSRSSDPFDSTPLGKTRLAKTQPLDWEGELDEAIGQLERVTADAPASGEEIRQHAVLRMLYLVANRREDALRPIEGIAPAQQDYWSKQLFALSTYLDENKQPDARRRATAAQSQLAEAAAMLGELGTLAVHNLAFCKDVRGFGIYTPIVEPRFNTGERVLLYAEVDNYRSVSTEKGFHTVLSTSYEVLDEQGRRVGGGDFPEVEDYCNNRRRDFHIQYGVVLPPHLAAGKYSLQLSIQDVLSNKIGRTSATFEIKGAR